MLKASVLISISAAILLTGCQKIPTEQIATAKNALEQARTAENECVCGG